MTDELVSIDVDGNTARGRGVLATDLILLNSKAKFLNLQYLSWYLHILEISQPPIFISGI